MTSSAYERLAAINVGPHIEKKNGLSYLSWAWALDQLLRQDAGATWEYGAPVMFGDTMMVSCTVHALGITRTAQLPVMDHRNKAIANPDAFAVNTAMQRCLVKAIALHGLGLYIYAGEDLPHHVQAEDATPEGYTEAQEAALRDLRAAAMEGTAKLKPAWEMTPPDVRKALRDELPALKAAAAEADAA